MDLLLKRVHEEVMSNPPLGYEPQEAVARFFEAAKAEIVASKEEVRFAPLGLSRLKLWRARRG